MVSDPPIALYLPTYRPADLPTYLTYLPLTTHRVARASGIGVARMVEYSGEYSPSSLVRESGQYIRYIYGSTYRGPDLARHQCQGKGGQRLEKGGTKAKAI